MKRTNCIFIICLLAECLRGTGFGHGVLLLVSLDFKFVLRLISVLVAGLTDTEDEPMPTSIKIET
jgi:hypothetical protein